MFWISFLRTWDSRYGYNLTRGGDGGVGRVCSQETRMKQSKARKGKYIGKNSPLFGRTHSEAYKEKMSLATATKLSNEDVVYIKQELFKGTKQKVLAELFHIDQSVISKIRNGRRWKYIKS